ncbi:hypothetical protein [Vibrio owensii]|uniref:hypothetical protein n=1 Tax=Vibrio owensii TaxID=696485 RepID=UPI0018F270DC|nr:hypothetical protein [Vibrio owensii]
MTTIQLLTGTTQHAGAIAALTINNRLIDSWSNVEEAQQKSSAIASALGIEQVEIQLQHQRVSTAEELVAIHLSKFDGIKNIRINATLTSDLGEEIIFDCQSYFSELKIKNELETAVLELVRINWSGDTQTDDIAEHYDDYLGEDLNLLAVRTLKHKASGYNCAVDPDSFRRWLTANAPEMLPLSL